MTVTEWKIVKDGEEITPKEVVELCSRWELYDPWGRHDEHSDWYIESCCKALLQEKMIDSFSYVGEIDWSPQDSGPGIVH